MRNRVLTIFAIPCAVGVSGCQSWVSPPDLIASDEATAKNQLEKDRDYRTPIILETFRFPEQPTGSAYNLALQDATGLARNRLLLALMNQSDQNCKVYMDSLYIRVAARKGLYQFTSLATSASSALIGGGIASQILAGISSVSTGTDAISDNVALQHQIVTIVNSTIKTTRDKARADLYTKRMTGNGPTPLPEYSVDQGISDVISSYDYACSFISALNTLSSTAALPKGQTKDSLTAERSTVKAELDELTKDVEIREATIAGLRSSNGDKGQIKTLDEINSAKKSQQNQLQNRITQIDSLLILSNQANVSP